MCGICGTLDLSADEQLAGARVAKMSHAIRHRGPDSQGVYVDRPIALGHRRLAIIDIESGQQPLTTDDGICTIVFNGEIYNFRELREQLTKRGHRFRTDCDTEVVLASYREFGTTCTGFLRGMFAFAIWDREKQTLFLARDRLGIKPLYYIQSNGLFAFASEIEAILESGICKPEVNVAVLDHFMSLGYVPGEDTMFDSIRKLPPGHQMIISGTRLETTKYWDVEVGNSERKGLATTLKEFDSILMESVKMHLMSDVPLGAFLSGGLDSSAIVYYMSQLSSSRVKTFSVGYSGNDGSSELPAAREIARLFDTDHHEFVLEPDNFFDSLRFCISKTEEPLVESAAVALYQLSKLASEHVTVILSGEGGDEILAGYPLYRINRYLSSIRRVAKILPGGSMDKLFSMLHGGEKYTKYSDWLRSPLNRRYLGISNDVTTSIKERMYTKEMLTAIGGRVEVYFQSIFDSIESATPLQRMSYTDLKTWLPDDLLLKADKMTMAASMELRVPFLDHEVVEYCLGLPDSLRLKGNTGKFLLKRLMEGRLPKSTIYQKKKGFPVPIEGWFRHELYKDISEILMDRKCLAREYFRPEYVENVLKAHKSGRENLSRRIMSLLTLELWHRHYID